MRVRTTRGDWFAKWNDDCAPDLFLGEAEGLRALRRPRSGLAIPEVLVALPPGEGRPACIVMEYLPPAGDAATTSRSAAGSRRSTRGRAEPSGFRVTTYCGPTPQDNRPSADAGPSSTPSGASGRSLRAARGARADRAGASGGSSSASSSACRRYLAHEPRPALIHGDLWSGNVLATTRGPALVDPACAACDREMEFGITTLFGGFSERFFAAYDEALPLPPGWRERNPLYQLYHLLNHHLIFGGHYGARGARDRAALRLRRRELARSTRKP